MYQVAPINCKTYKTFANKVMSWWQLKIGCGETIYTMKTHKFFKSVLFKKLFGKHSLLSDPTQLTLRKVRGLLEKLLIEKSPKSKERVQSQVKIEHQQMFYPALNPTRKLKANSLS